MLKKMGSFGMSSKYFEEEEEQYPDSDADWREPGTVCARKHSHEISVHEACTKDVREKTVLQVL